MTAQPKFRMTAAEYLDWTSAQARGRFELVRGEVVAQAPERAMHNLAKGAIYRALSDAVKGAGLDCSVFTDGMTIVIDDETAREPDASVQCGKPVAPDAVVLDAPTIVVEVVSPSSERDDTGEKLIEYFKVASIAHYVIVNPAKAVVVHHQRAAGEIRTRIACDGNLDLDPPGIRIAVADCLGGH